MSHPLITEHLLDIKLFTPTENISWVFHRSPKLSLLPSPGHQEVDPQERMMIADAGALLGSGPQAQGNTHLPTERDPPAPASDLQLSANPPPDLGSVPHHHASAPPPHTKGQAAPGSVHLLPGPNPEDVPLDPQVLTQSLPGECVVSQQLFIVWSPCMFCVN